MKDIKMRQSILYLLFFLAFFSCSGEDALYDVMSSKDLHKKTIALDGNDTDKSVYKFRYQGRSYEAQISVVDDSIMVFKDKEIELLYDSLQCLPELVTFISKDGYIEFFNSKGDFYSNLKRLTKISVLNSVAFQPITRALANRERDYDANLYLYDYDNYGDKEEPFHLEKNQNERKEPRLQNFNMNDKTTSFIAYVNNYTTALFELFEDDTYKNHCLSFVLEPGYEYMMRDQNIVIGPATLGDYAAMLSPNLKHYKVQGTVRSSWNDRITSFRITRQ